MKLKIGDRFKPTFSTENRLLFEIVSINQENNECKVKVVNQQGYSWEETWDDLDITENAFEIGEYMFCERL